jgi:thioredoxin reductase
LNETQKKNVTVNTKCTVKEIEKQDEKYIVRTNSGDFEADYIVYTTGSSPKSLKLLKISVIKLLILFRLFLHSILKMNC